MKVESSPESPPIHNLRDGFSLQGIGDVTLEEIETIWKGPEELLQRMWAVQTPKSKLDTVLYHASSNENGLHLFPANDSVGEDGWADGMPGGYCRWDLSGEPASVEVWVGEDRQENIEVKEEDPHNWVRIWHQVSGDRGAYDLTIPEIMMLAETTSCVRIIQADNRLLRIDSVPDSSPIQNLRDGYSMQGNGYTTLQDIRKIWRGPDHLLWRMWAQNTPASKLETALYHASNNEKGLHLFPQNECPGKDGWADGMSDGCCRWSLNGKPAPIEVWLGGDRGRGWIRIFHQVAGDECTYDMPVKDIVKLAKRKTIVRICRAEDSNYKVESRQNTLPIQNLREGIALNGSHDETSLDDINSFWEGNEDLLPRLRSNNTKVTRLEEALYLASCNKTGLHLKLPTLDSCFPKGICRFDFSGKPDAVEVWLGGNMVCVAKNLHTLSFRRYTCIASNIPYQLHLDFQDIQELASRAKCVVIRSVSNPFDFVVSKDNSFPIQRVALGRDLSQSIMKGDLCEQPGGGITKEIVLETWQGPKFLLDTLTNHWPAGGDRRGLARLYWACSNINGLHFVPIPRSGWFYQRPCNLEILVDAELRGKKREKHPDLARKLPSLCNWLNVLNWNSEQTVAFIRSLGRDKGIFKLCADVFEKNAYRAEVLLSGTFGERELGSLFSVMYGECSVRGCMTQKIALAMADCSLLSAFLWKSFAIQAYKLMGGDLIAAVEDAQPKNNADVCSGFLGDLRNLHWNGHFILPGSYEQSHIQMDCKEDWELVIDFRTKSQSGAIFTIAFEDGIWKKGDERGQCKVLLLKAGKVYFDVGSEGGISHREDFVNDGNWHTISLCYKKNEDYHSILLDGKIGTEGHLPGTPHHPETTFSLGRSVGHMTTEIQDMTVINWIRDLHTQLSSENGTLRHLKDSKWFEDPCSPYDVSIKVLIEDVSEIDPLNESARVRFMIFMWWWNEIICDWDLPDSHFNFAEDGSLSKRESCEAIPVPKLRFVNAVDEVCVISMIHKRIQEWGSVETKMLLEGVFYDPVEVSDFPFDIQDFRISICFEEGREYNFVPSKRCLHDKKSMVDFCSEISAVPISDRNPEWLLLPLDVVLENSKFTAILNLQRKSQYYTMNVVFPLFLISTINLTAWSIEGDSFGDRFGVLGTVLLTTVATKFTYADSVPKVSYPTLLDWYITTIFVHLFFVTVMTAVVAYNDGDELLDKIVFWLNLSTWIAEHIYFTYIFKTAKHKN